MAPKSSQSFLLHIRKKDPKCISEYLGVKLRKIIFAYSLIFLNGRCSKYMKFQKVVFYTSDTIDSYSSYRILGSDKVFL